MDTRAQHLIQQMHREWGATDREIAALLRPPCARETINRIKHGKLACSEVLTADLEDVLQWMREIRWRPGRKHFYRRKNGVRPRQSPDQRVPNLPAALVTSPNRPPNTPKESPTSKVTPPSPPAAPRPQESLVDEPSRPRPESPTGISYLPSSALCVACQRPGVPTRLYEGKALCQWCAVARGYSAPAPPATFVPQPTQHEPQVTQPIEKEGDVAPPPDPSTWVFPDPGLSRKYLDYQRGMYCVACHAHTPTRQVHVAGAKARSVRLCEPCWARYGV